MKNTLKTDFQSVFRANDSLSVVNQLICISKRLKKKQLIRDKRWE